MVAGVAGVADSFHVRRVVVGRGAQGAPAALADGVPPQTISSPTGFGVSELLWSAGPLGPATAGGDPPREGVGAFPTHGGVAARIIRFPATDEWVRIAGDDPARPGMHRSETLDLMVVLSGRITLGVEDGADQIVGSGDAVIQRGTMHRWRVSGDAPCTYLSVLLAPIDGAPVPSPPLPRLTAEAGPQLLITGAGPHGSVIEAAGSRAADENGCRRWWDTAGPLRSVTQGGTADRVNDGAAKAEHRSVPGAVSLTLVDLAAAGSAGFCTAPASIDLVVVRSGTVQADVTESDSGTAPSTTAGQFGALRLSTGDVLLSRAVPMQLTSASAELAVISFSPMTAD